MNNNRITLQPAFVLHSRPYRDTSLLIELLTAQYGRLTVIARGVRRVRSNLSGLLLPFFPLLVSFSGKTDLQTLQQAEANGLNYNLSGERLLCGFYLNELLIRLLQRHDPHPYVYHLYQQTLSNLVGGNIPEVVLRLFEKRLITDLGYGLQLDRTVNNETVQPEEKYSFEFGVGLKKIKAGDRYFLGKSLLALHNETLITAEELRDAKQLLRSVIATLLDHKPLKCRELLLNMKKLHVD